MINSKIKVLQITPHLGGGLGRVIINWIREERKLNTDVTYTLCSLENTNNATEDFSDLNDILYIDMYNKKELLDDLIRKSDIVVVNWYNHPLLFDLLCNFSFTDCRLICYNHVSSLYPPYTMSEKLINFFDYVVFTTKASYEATEIKKLKEENKLKLTTIESAFGSEYYDYNFEKCFRSDFIVGYTGTCSYAKLDSKFPEICNNVKSDVKFVVCSGDSQDHIIKDVEKLDASHKFKFKGRVDNVFEELYSFKVFGYPLQHYHLGSAEQSIGEAMVSGAVPVVLNNRAENYIIENNKTGIIAQSYEEYSNAIDYLYNNPLKLNYMSKKAHTFAKYRYSLKRKIDSWEKVFLTVLNLNKKKRQWDSKKNEFEPYEVFFESLGNYSEIFKKSLDKNDSSILELEYDKNPQWKSSNKGSVSQYYKYFPYDENLKKLKGK